MALGTPTLETKGNSTSDANSYNTASVSFVSGVQYLIAFSVSRNGAVPDSPTISGATSGTWTSIDGATFNPAAAAQRSRMGIRRYLATSTFSEVINIATTNNCEGALWVVFSVTGVHATPVVQSAFNRGDAATSASVSLAATVAGNLVIGAFSSDTASNVFTAGGTCTLLDQISRTDVNHTLAVVYSAADEDPSVTMASADWGGSAFELAADTATGQPAVRRYGGIPYAQPGPAAVRNLRRF